MKKKSGKRPVLRAICVILVILLLLTAVELFYSNYVLTVSTYTVSSEKVNGPIRVVFLADLHEREFGTGNRRLLKKISAQKPDVIAFVGDFINKDADKNEIEQMCAFVRNASKIAPVYFSMGNQEKAFERDTGIKLADRLEEAGALVLDSRFLDIDIEGTLVRIGGYMGYYRTPHLNSKDSQEQKLQLAFADDFEDTDRFKLLLNHIPTNWLDWDYRDNYPVDLVLSGHYHGGVVRIPFLEQGLYAPYAGKFPPYTKGMFVGKKATCVLTTGLAGSYGIPRFFNPPEICVVDIVPAD